MNRDVKIEQLLPYSSEMVWRALTDPGLLGSWLMENDFKPELNKSFTFRMKPQRGWDGITHCEVIEYDPPQRVAYTYRGKASGEKVLSCAGVDSRSADKAVKGIFAELDTVLRFTVTPDRACDGVERRSILLLEHTGFRGFKLVLVSFVMGMGWRKILGRLAGVLAGMKREATTVGSPRGEVTSTKTTSGENA